MNFLGVDVGFATSSLTTGLAWRIGDEVGATKTGTSWKRRREVLPSGITYSIAALDAPILPEHEEQSHRGCESIFYGGAFWNRCRPGLSHHGRALGLRRAGADAASQFATVVSGLDLVSELQVRRNCAIVEAFPNTFLGVLLPEAIYEDRDFGFSERKSDWMYRKVAERGIFRKLLIQLGWTEPGTITQFHDQAGLDGNHDVRAALICLLTAGFAASGNAVVIGDPTHGWFWLPPKRFWEEWAWTALRQQLHKLKSGKFPMVDVWKGQFFAAPICSSLAERDAARLMTALQRHATNADRATE
jgi:hypothetical protein